MFPELLPAPPGTCPTKATLLLAGGAVGPAGVCVDNGDCIPGDCINGVCVNPTDIDYGWTGVSHDQDVAGRQRCAGVRRHDELAGALDGQVIVEVTVDSEGKATHPRVLISSSPIFEAAALESAKTYRYRPATRQGKPVSVTMNLVMIFKHTARPDP